MTGPWTTSSSSASRLVDCRKANRSRLWREISISYAKTIPNPERTAVSDLESGDDEIASAVVEGAEVEAHTPELLVTGVFEIV